MEDSLQLCFKVLIQESVDKWVDNVVNEVHVKNNHIHFDNAGGHKPCWQERYDEDDRHDEEGAGSFDIGHPHALDARVGKRTFPHDRGSAGTVVVRRRRSTASIGDCRLKLLGGASRVVPSGESVLSAVHVTQLDILRHLQSLGRRLYTGGVPQQAALRRLDAQLLLPLSNH